MTDPSTRESEYQLTPEEDRFLRSFFDRRAGRYLIGMAIVMLAVLMLGRRGDTPVAAAPAP